MLHPVDATEITVSMNGPETYALMRAILERVQNLVTLPDDEQHEMEHLLALLVKMGPHLYQKVKQYRDELN